MVTTLAGTVSRAIPQPWKQKAPSSRRPAGKATSLTPEFLKAPVPIRRSPLPSAKVTCWRRPQFRKAPALALLIVSGMEAVLAPAAPQTTVRMDLLKAPPETKMTGSSRQRMQLRETCLQLCLLCARRAGSLTCCPSVHA